MKLIVTSVGDPWTPPGGDKPLFTFHAERMGEPLKTWDSGLARVGEHEAIKYTAKSGKEYWKLDDGTGASSPTNGDVQNAIQRQHSQEMALRYLAISKETVSLDRVASLTDWFEDNISGTKTKVPEITDADLGF